MANISGATVSRVLSGRTDLAISAETRAKVIAAAEKLGYQPNQSARALMTGTTGLVGFWMSLAYSRYRSLVLDRMRTIMGRTDLALAVTDVDEEFHWHHSFSRALRVPVDGIIAFDTSESGETFARNHERLAPSTPFVSMGAYWSEAKSYVGVDLRAGADMAMDHLLETGRKRIAYLAPTDSDTLHTGARADSYREKMEAAGFAQQVISTDAVNLASVKRALLPLQESKNLPEAILCMNDDIAIATEFVLQQMGVMVGTDVALVGFDGLEETELAPCPISTVRQPIEEMCDLAWNFLRTQMDGSVETVQQKILKPSLVIRDSSRR